MTAVLPESWGAYKVTHVVAAALAVARSRAATRGETTPRVSDVAFAVLSAPDSLASAALTAVGIAPGDLLAELSTPGDPGSEAGDERITVLLARADWERRRTNDDGIGSVHLTAALAALPDVELATLHGAGIDLDLLRTGAARTIADAPQGDRAFALPPRPPVLLAQEPPEIAELLTRTKRSRSASLKQLLDSQLPAGSNVTSSVYGTVLVRRWARFTEAHQVLLVVTMLLAVRSGMHWWIYLPLIPALATPTNLPATVWVTFVAAAAVLCPQPVAAALLLTAAAGAAKSWYELWMKRIDLAEPGTTLRDIRRATRRTGERLLLRKLGLDDDD